MDLGLEGRVAFVTGAGSGIGAAVALRLATEGARVAILDLALDRAQDTLERCLGTGVDAVAVEGDVSNRSDVEAAVRTSLGRFHRIDILVHSAGIVRISGPLDENDEGWDRVMAVHLRGARNVCRAVVPSMIGQRYGKIVLLGSLAAHIEGGDYGAAMAAKLHYMRDLARVLAPHNVNVNAVSPGKIMTPLQEPYFPTETDRRTYARDHIPLQRDGRDYPVAEDVADPIVLLCSDRMSHVTGVELHVNGGEYIQA